MFHRIIILISILVVSCASVESKVETPIDNTKLWEEWVAEYMSEKRLDYCNKIGLNMFEMNKQLARLLQARKIVASREPLNSPKVMEIDAMIEDVADWAEDIEEEFERVCMDE